MSLERLNEALDMWENDQFVKSQSWRQYQGHVSPMPPPTEEE